MWECAVLHFRVKAAALRERSQFHISDGSGRGGQRRKEIQKPWVFGGVLFPISFAVERNGAAGGNEKWVAPEREITLIRLLKEMGPPEGAIRAPPVADKAEGASGRGQNFKRPP